MPNDSSPSLQPTPEGVASALRECRVVAEMLAGAEIEGGTETQRRVLNDFARQLDLLALEAMFHFPEVGP